MMLGVRARNAIGAALVVPLIGCGDVDGGAQAAGRLKPLLCRVRL